MFLEWIFNKECFICGKKIGKIISFTCENCSNILKYELCEYSDTHVSNQYFDELYSVFAYRNIVRYKILDFKFNNKPYLVYLFGYFVLGYLLKNNVRADVIIPVPIHYKRYKERGYNQSEILSRFISKKMGIKFEAKVLKKIKYSEKQSRLNAKQRIANVFNTFVVSDRQKILEKTIILIDDIYTTGATVNECSRVLKENGASRVIVVTIAHGKFKLGGT